MGWEHGTDRLVIRFRFHIKLRLIIKAKYRLGLIRNNRQEVRLASFGNNAGLETSKYSCKPILY